VSRKEKVLFVCIHNSARSQMAEAFLKFMAADRYEAKSAGLEPGVLNPLVVEVMAEIGIDIANNRTKSVYDLLKGGESFDYVITVCDDASAEACPAFPGPAKKIHWGFNDPARIEGSREERLEKIRVIRYRIRSRIQEWLTGAT
jgi:arsenate reductase